MVHIAGINRRVALGLVPMAWLGAAVAAGPRRLGAPDAVSQAVLRRRLPRVDSGAGDFAARIHGSFPQIIEQNFALRGSRATAELLDGMTEQELADLAILYTNASQSKGGAGQLLPMLAHRLDDARLVRVCDHFGFGPTYAALSAIAPQRTSRFAMRANRNAMEPRIELFRPKVSYSLPSGGTQQPSGFQRVGYVRTLARYLDYTPYQIYLDFRTAPVGALSVSGALWEAAVVLSTRLGSAFSTGYAIGTFVVEPLIRNYAPALYERIGAGVAGAVNQLSSSWSGSVQEQGIAQSATAPIFGSTPLQMNYFSMGGDFNVSSSWSSAFSSGGGCHPICIDVSY